MPILYGQCIPPVCVRVVFDTTKATASATKNGAPTNINPMLQGMVNNYLATLKNPAISPCDTDCCDCVEFKNQNPPPQAVPAQDIASITIGKNTYVLTVNGVTAKVFWGICVPKPPPKQNGKTGGSEKSETKKPKKPSKKKPKRR